MKSEILAHLHDILRSAKAIREFTANRTFNDYSSDEFFRSAVERKFEIIGEALNRIKRDAPEILEQIPQHRDIVSFRNILIHGYDTINDHIVWDVIEEELDDILDAVARLLHSE